MLATFSEYKAAKVKTNSSESSWSLVILVEHISLSVFTLHKWKSSDNKAHGSAARSPEMVERGKVELFPAFV